MTEPPSVAAVQASFCEVVVDEWARAGVTDAVVAPGSRSTPLVVALDAQPAIGVHVVLDERSAGFVAVGLATATGRPPVVVTTSGTAAAELHPAVVEACHAGAPLIVVTADRPPELQDVGAPQTIEQAGLFGRAVVWSASPGPPEPQGSASWRSLGARSAAEAHGRASGARPGPVHLNLAFREPLVADPGEPRGGGWSPPGARAGRAPWHAVSCAEPAFAGAEVVDLAASHGGRGLIVAGAGSGEPVGVLEASRQLGWPLLADPRSGCRRPWPTVVAAADALLRPPAAAGVPGPDLVVRLGEPWASRVLSEWISGLPACVPQVVVRRDGRWVDPGRSASHVVAGDPSAFMRAVAAAQRTYRRDGASERSDWLARWSKAEAAAQVAIERLLGEGGGLEMTEPAVARALMELAPSGSQLVVSSSMPIRDLEWYAAPRDGVRVLANRGANGIDGVLSTAVGAALGAALPTVALLGDLAFLHDAGALLGAGERGISLTVLIVDNDGGGIFSFLPQAEVMNPVLFERYWGTPHRLDLGSVAAAYGADVARVRSRSELRSLVERAEERGVRVGVLSSHRHANVAAHDRIHAEIRASVAGALSRPALTGARAPRAAPGA